MNLATFGINLALKNTFAQSRHYEGLCSSDDKVNTAKSGVSKGD